MYPHVFLHQGTVPLPVELCEDISVRCTDIGPPVCEGERFEWAKTNCRKTCGFCVSGKPQSLNWYPLTYGRHLHTSLNLTWRYFAIPSGFSGSSIWNYLTYEIQN